MKNNEMAIVIKDLKKSFGSLEVLKGINLQVKRGSVYGVLGPNGAGKTTLVSIMSTLLRPDSGSVSIFGYDTIKEADTVRRCIGLTGQFASIDEELSGRDNLKLFGRLLGYSGKMLELKVNQLLEAFELSEAAERPAETYSGGMRRRLDIAAAMLVNPDLLFLDEPTTGLDPRSRNSVWEIVRTLVEQGTTVLLTTQYLEEADQLADRLAVIDQGEVIAEGTPNELKEAIGSGILQIRLAHPKQKPEAERVLKQELNITTLHHSDPALLTATVSDPDIAAQALTALSQAGIKPKQFSIGQLSLDEVFLSLTGKTIPDQAKEEVL